MSARPHPTRVRPSRWWLVGALVLLLGGIGGCSGMSIASARNVFDPTVLPGNTVRLDRGDYTVFTAFVSARVSIDGPDGSPVEVSDYENTLTITKGDLEYEATGTFTAPNDGVYTVSVDGPGRVAIGRGLESGLLVSGLVLGAIAGTIGFVVAIVVLTKRSTSRNRLRAAELAPRAGGLPAPPPAPF